MSKEEVDPEIVEDRDVQETPLVEIELPPYDPTQFELDDDFEYIEEDDEDDG